MNSLVGHRAGSQGVHGYRAVFINSRSYKEHRLAFLYMTGSWPSRGVDHVDLVKSNNAWCNLREATDSQNAGNVPRRSDNTSGYKGVSWHRGQEKYNARIMVRGKMMALGSFDTAEQAHAVYAAAAHKFFADFARVE